MKLPPHWLPINLVGLDLGLWGPAIQRYAEAYARQAQRMALEEAAKLCREVNPSTGSSRYTFWNDCALAIDRLANELDEKP